MKKANEQRNQRASIFLHTDPLKMAKINTTRFSCTGLPWMDLIRFGSFAMRCFLVALQ